MLRLALAPPPARRDQHFQRLGKVRSVAAAERTALGPRRLRPVGTPFSFFFYTYFIFRTANSLETFVQLQIQFLFGNIIKLIRLHIKVSHILFRSNIGKRKRF